MGANQVARLVALADRELNLSDGFTRALRFRFKQDFDPILLQDCLHTLGDIRVLSVQQLPRRLHDGHSAAKPPEQLPEFQAHVTAAEHQQMFGNTVQFHDRSAVEKWHIRQSIQLGHRWARPRIDENAICRKSSLRTVARADTQALGAHEARFAKDHVEVRCFLQTLLAAVAKAVHNVALSLAHPRHINSNITRIHAILFAPPSQIRDAPARHHRLRRRAALIDASSTYMAPLDERRPQSRTRKRYGQRRAPLPRADHNRLVMVWRVHGEAPWARIEIGCAGPRLETKENFCCMFAFSSLPSHSVVETGNGWRLHCPLGSPEPLAV